MDFQQKSNTQFFTSFKEKVADERRITVEVLRFFREAERRMLYAEYGCSSLLRKNAAKNVGILKLSI